VRPGAERADTDLGVRSTTRVRGICWRRGPRIYVSPSERGGRSICRDHLLQAKESTRDFVVVRPTSSSATCLAARSRYDFKDCTKIVPYAVSDGRAVQVTPVED
jgi:hypothetical protein